MKSKRRFIGLLICLVVTAGVLGLYLRGTFEGLESEAYDYRFRLRGEKPPFQGLVIVNVDEASIDQLGRWPWPRSIHARLIDRLDRAGAKVIAFDVLFTEPDLKEPDSDAKMALSIKRSGKVVLDEFFDMEGGELSALHLPLPQYREAAGLGFANFFPDVDGVDRKASLVLPYQEHLVPSMALAAVMKYRGQTLEQMSDFLSHVPTDKEGDLLLNYHGPYQTFPYVSYAEALRGGPSDGFYRDKIVLVGGTAAALFDMKPSPFAPVFPGVEIQATVIDNLMTQNYLKRVPGWAIWAGLIVMGFLMGVCLPRMSPLAGALLASGLVAGVFAFGYFLFSQRLLVLDVVVFAIEGVGSYLGVITYRLVTEEREKRWIKSTFSQYLSPKVIVILVQDPSRLKLGGEERQVSIFFSDIEHFTTISEELGTAQLVEFLNRYLTIMSDIILKYDGVVDKYIGDAIMAFWNAPLDQPTHARVACLTALDCQESLKHFRLELKAKGLPMVHSRIGLNTGPAKVGNMGSKTRLSYTAIGDSVNLASRLEGANKAFGTYLMISESTYEAAKPDIEARQLDRILVIGKREPIRVYELLSRRGELTPEFKKGIECYEEALALYHPGREFSKAKERFRQVSNFIPDDPVAKVYIERCEAYSAKPPHPDWDGVYTMMSK